MRTYVCAQCHVEYYFKGDHKVLTFPWSKGLKIEEIEKHYDEYGFKDWTHDETGAPMLKIQHPEFEMWSTGLHARSGVACADCHMPYMREGAVKVSDHWVRSPLVNINQACQTCHKQDEQELKRSYHDHPEQHGRAAAQGRRGAWSRRWTPSRPRRPAAPRRTAEGRAAIPPQGRLLLGLRGSPKTAPASTARRRRARAGQRHRLLPARRSWRQSR